MFYRFVASQCGKVFVSIPAYGNKTTQPASYRGHYYRCQGSLESEKGSSRCRAKQLRADRYERIVWLACRDIIIKPNLIRKVFASQKPEHVRSRISKTRQTLQYKLIDLKQQESRITSLARLGKSSLDVISEQLEEIHQERQKIEHELLIIEQQQQMARIQEDYISRAEGFLTGMRQELNQVEDFYHTPKILRSIGKHVSINEGLSRH